VKKAYVIQISKPRSMGLYSLSRMLLSVKRNPMYIMYIKVYYIYYIKALSAAYASLGPLPEAHNKSRCGKSARTTLALFGSTSSSLPCV
jgi:hypothetical protein